MRTSTTPCGARPRAAVTTHPTTTARSAASDKACARGGWVVIGRGRDLFGVCAATAPQTRTHPAPPRSVCGKGSGRCLEWREMSARVAPLVRPRTLPGVPGAPQRARRAEVALSPATRGGSR